MIRWKIVHIPLQNACASGQVGVESLAPIYCSLHTLPWDPHLLKPTIHRGQPAIGPGFPRLPEVAPDPVQENRWYTLKNLVGPSSGDMDCPVQQSSPAQIVKSTNPCLLYDDVALIQT